MISVTTSPIRPCVAAVGFLRSRTALLYLVALPLTTRWFHTQSPVVSSILAYRMELILQQAMSATCLPFRGVKPVRFQFSAVGSRFRSGCRGLFSVTDLVCHDALAACEPTVFTAVLFHTTTTHSTRFRFPASAARRYHLRSRRLSSPQFSQPCTFMPAVEVLTCIVILIVNYSLSITNYVQAPFPDVHTLLVGHVRSCCSMPLLRSPYVSD